MLLNVLKPLIQFLAASATQGRVVSLEEFFETTDSPFNADIPQISLTRRTVTARYWVVLTLVH